MLRVPGRGNSCWEIHLHCITVLMIIACLLLNNCDVVKCFNRFFALYYLIKRSVKKKFYCRCFIWFRDPRRRLLRNEGDYEPMSLAAHFGSFNLNSAPLNQAILKAVTQLEGELIKCDYRSYCIWVWIPFPTPGISLDVLLLQHLRDKVHTCQQTQFRSLTFPLLQY